MFEEIIKIGASWDWITPLWAFVQDWRYSPATHFTTPYGGIYSAKEIQWYLQGKGIKVWGLLVVGDTILFSVREAQSDYTEYHLRQLGIYYTGGLSPKNKKRSTKKR